MKVGVLFHGCGVFDGTEIHEAVLTLLFLDKVGAEAVFMAPGKKQFHVFNHLKGEVAVGEERCVLEESARIARGNIKSIKDISADDIDALIIPGGFGAAKNLTDFAVNGENCTIDSQVEHLIKEVNKKGKPIGAICIAPAVIARALGKDVKPVLTIGNDKGTGEKLEIMGAKHQDCSVSDCVVDKKNKIVSTPAYMLGPGIKDIAQGIEALVKEVVKLV